MREFELQTNFSHLWWGRKRLCFKYKNTVGLQIFVRRSIRTLNISPFHPSPPLYPFSASPLRLLPLPSSASSPSPPPPPPPPLLCLLSLLSSVSSPCPLRLLPPPFRPPHPPPPPFTSSPSPFLEEKDNQNTKRKNKSYEFSIQLRTKIDNWNICHRLLLAVPERYLLSLRTKSITSHSTSHSFAALTIELWSWTGKKRFHI